MLLRVPIRKEILYEDLNSHLLTLTQLAEESTAGVSSNPHIYHDLLYVVPRVCVSRRTLQCRVRHLTPTYVMTNELQKEILVDMISDDS